MKQIMRIDLRRFFGGHTEVHGGVIKVGHCPCGSTFPDAEMYEPHKPWKKTKKYKEWLDKDCKKVDA